MKITFLGGDGIGVEVAREAFKVLLAISDTHNIKFDFSEGEIGGSAIDKTGSPLPDETIELCLNSDAVLLGAVGSPKYDDFPADQRPEIGLLRLRRKLGGFANLRPSKVYKSLAQSSPLRPEVLKNTDLLIVRELLGGLYFGEPRGFDDNGGDKKAYNTMHYTVSEVERVARVAFESAGKRGKRLASVDKANVLETSRLWRETVNKIAAEFPEIAVEHLYVDACAMLLVTNPSRFDVILTENLFGDILSDEAAVLTGSLGMLASATVGGSVDLYEPVHGSAPDIAGKNIANPCGAIASAAMLMRHTANRPDIAAIIETAIENVLEKGFRTVDIARSSSENIVSTSRIGDAVVESIYEISETKFAYHAV